MPESWTKYTITAVLGVACGLVATYTTAITTTAERLSKVEAELPYIRKALDRIEQKLAN